METTQPTSTGENEASKGKSQPQELEDPITHQKSEEPQAALDDSHQTPDPTPEGSDQEKERGKDEDEGDGDPSTGKQVKEHIERASKQFMDYISQLESRIEQLETNKAVVVSKREGTQATGSKPAICKFFLEADEPPYYTVNKVDNRWKTPGTFRSEVDAPSLIRVLYTWIEPQSADEGGSPSPNGIDILELRIASKPVTDFLGQKLEYDLSQDGVMHIVKPFRVLIRNFSSIKEEFNRLVKQK